MISTHIKSISRKTLSRDRVFSLLHRLPTGIGNAVAKIRKTEESFVIACNHKTGFWERGFKLRPNYQQMKLRALK